MAQNKDFIFADSMNDLPEKVSFAWKSPSNIALVKYWGKTDPQIPKNASISFTLSESYTKTTAHFTKKKQSGISEISVTLGGEKMDSFVPKIAQFLERINVYTPYLSNYHVEIITENSFPHSSGIASSASGMSALALCVMSLEKWNENLEQAFSLGINHISSYALTVESKTALDHFIKSGKYKAPIDALTEKHFEILREETKKQQYIQYQPTITDLVASFEFECDIVCITTTIIDTT